MKRFSQACDNNKQAIVTQLRTAFAAVNNVLEVGSGTGQHAVYFGAELSHLQWHTSDLPANHAGIRAWLAEADLANVLPPIVFDVEQAWPELLIDAVFTANTLHIMAWPQVVALFEHLAIHLPAKGMLVVYGPFNYGGDYTAESNRAFDAHLKQQASHMGIRDFEKIHALAEEANLLLKDDIAMPANNHLLVYQKV